jgi:hypothetical protein
VYRHDADTGIRGDVLAEMTRVAVAVPRSVFFEVIPFVPPPELTRSGPAQKRVRVTGVHDR